MLEMYKQEIIDMRWVRCGSMHVALRFDQRRKGIVVIDGLFLNLNVLDNDTLVFSLVSKGHWNVMSITKMESR